MLAPHPLRTSDNAPAPRGNAAARPGGMPEGSTAEGLLVVVAGVHGRFRPLVTQGRVVVGALLGHITGGGRSEEVRAPAHLDVQGLLARPGHLVTPGQALVWASQVQATA